jgi:hypothetical protein
MERVGGAFVCPLVGALNFLSYNLPSPSIHPAGTAINGTQLHGSPGKRKKPRQGKSTVYLFVFVFLYFEIGFM